MFVSPFDPRFAFVVLSAAAAVGHEPHPEEAQVLSPGASWKRRHEFTLGRVAASFALKQLGFAPPPPVLKGGDGEPLWPQGIIGSISHCETWAIAVAAQQSISAAIGIDLERVSLGNEEIADSVCHRSEMGWAKEGDNCRERITMIFSAKEAIFKAFFPICKRFINFKEVKLSWIFGKQRFLGEFLTDLTPVFKRGFQFEVGCERKRDFVFTYLVQNFLPDSRSRL